jgi:hypothetical protein
LRAAFAASGFFTILPPVAILWVGFLVRAIVVGVLYAVGVLSVEGLAELVGDNKRLFRYKDYLGGLAVKTRVGGENAGEGERRLRACTDHRAFAL